jgi:hypothetical protein
MVSMADNMKNKPMADATLEGCIKDAEKHYGTTRDNLEWRVDGTGAIHIRRKQEGKIVVPNLN